MNYWHTSPEFQIRVQLQNLWGTVQSENTVPLIHQLLRISKQKEGHSIKTALNQAPGPFEHRTPWDCRSCMPMKLDLVRSLWRFVLFSLSNLIMLLLPFSKHQGYDNCVCVCVYVHTCSCVNLSYTLGTVSCPNSEINLLGYLYNTISENLHSRCHYFKYLVIIISHQIFG